MTKADVTKVTTEITRHELEGYRMMLSGDLKKAKEFLHQESSDAIAELAYSALCYKSYLSSLVKAADKVDKAGVLGLVRGTSPSGAGPSKQQGQVVKVRTDRSCFKGAANAGRRTERGCEVRS